MKRIIFSITAGLAVAILLTACAGSGDGGPSGSGPGVSSGSIPQPNTFYVDLNNTKPGNGRSWEKAYSDLSDALLAVAYLNSIQPETIKVIWIAKGIYTPKRNGLATPANDLRLKHFTLLNDVKIYGGFAGGESTLAARLKNGDKFVNEVILSGDIGTKVDASDNVYNVVRTANLKNTAQLHDVTIMGGNASSTPHTNGGGVYNYYSSPIFINVTISNNTAKGGGGGVYNDNSNTIFTDVTITNNTATDQYSGGGGVYNNGGTLTFTNVTISDNDATANGGGVYNNGGNPAFTNVTISDNTAGGNDNVPFGGGGVYNGGSGKPTFTNVTINGNTTGSGSQRGLGGGVFNDDSMNNEPEFTNVTISNNTANGSGGGVFNRAEPIFTNVTISGNTATDNGGGVYNNGAPTLINATISDNTATDSGGGLYSSTSTVNIINTIIWGNKVGTTPSPTAARAGISPTTGTINIAHSIIQNAQLGNSDTEVQDKGNSNAKIGNNRDGNSFTDPALAAALAKNDAVSNHVQTIKIDDTSPAAGAGAYVKACNTSSYCFNTNANATGNWNNVTGGTAAPTGDALNQTDARGYNVPTGKVAIGAYNPDATKP